jgi:hypothetical protein
MLRIFVKMKQYMTFFISSLYLIIIVECADAKKRIKLYFLYPSYLESAALALLVRG